MPLFDDDPDGFWAARLASVTEARIKDFDAWPPLFSRKDQKPMANPICKP